MKNTLVLYTFFVFGAFYSQSVLLTVNKDTVYTRNFENKYTENLKALGTQEAINGMIDFELLKQFAVEQGVLNSEAFNLQVVKEVEKLKDSLYYPKESVDYSLKYYYEKLQNLKKVQILIFNDEVLAKEEGKKDKFVNSVIKEIHNDTLLFKKAVEKYSVIQAYGEAKNYDIFPLKHFLLDFIYQVPLGKVSKLKKGNTYFLVLVSGNVKDSRYSNYSAVKYDIYNRLVNSPAKIYLEMALIEELKRSSFFYHNPKGIDHFVKSLPKIYNNFIGKQISKTDTLVGINNKVFLTNKDLWEQLQQVEENGYDDIKDIAYQAIEDWEAVNLLQFYSFNYYETDRFKKEIDLIKDEELVKYAFLILTIQAKNDMEGQKKFLKENAGKLVWKERLEGIIYNCLNEDIQKQVLKMIKSNKKPSYIEKHFKGKVDSDNNQLLSVEQGKFFRKTVNLPEDEPLKKTIYTTDFKTKKLIIQIKNILANDPITLEELRTKYIQNYIDYSISETLNKLRKEAVISKNEPEVKYLEKKYSL